MEVIIHRRLASRKAFFNNDNRPRGCHSVPAHAFSSRITGVRPFSVPNMSIPINIDSPLLARQWLKTHVRTRAVTTPISVTLTLLLAYLTYKSKTPNKKYLLTSTLLLLTRFPYSEILLGPYNRRLSAKAESMATAGLDDVQAEANMSPGDTVHELVDRWANLYLGKALLVLGAGFSVLYGLV